VAEVLALASFGRRGVSAARTALGRARRSRTRPGTDHPRPFGTGLALPTSAPTSDVRCRRTSTGAAAPATASATIAPHEAGHGVTRTPRATAPSPGLGAKACAPRTSATLPDPTTRIASAHRSSRELGPLHPYPCAPTYATARVHRALAPPKLHRQHFARSSYRCGIRLTGSCNSIFKDEHPSLHRLLRPCGQSELRTSRRSAHFDVR
jgi:hypothetical protein